MSFRTAPFYRSLVSCWLVALLLQSPLASATDVPFTKRDAGSGTGHTWSFHGADVDGDGDLDFVVPGESDDVMHWLENDGGRPATFTLRPVTATVNEPRAAFAADLDGDGDVDLLSASSQDDRIAWYENDGADDPTFTQITISTAADGAYDVVAADLDGDGDIDVASSSIIDDKIIWYENDGAVEPSFTAITITTSADGAREVNVADLDGDGDLDLLSANTEGGTVSWYENDGAADPTFTKIDLLVALNGPFHLVPTDMNLDGHMDMLVAFSIAGTVWWYENDGAADPLFTVRTVAAGINDARAVDAADFDCDGDMDVLISTGTESVYWYESDGASPPSYTQRPLDVGLSSVIRSMASDVDGDGDMDVIAADYAADAIKYYENRLIHKDVELPNETIVDDASTSGPTHVEMGDLNGDGIVDFVVSELFGGTVEWYINDGAGGYSRRSMGSPSASTDLRIVDLDGDGDRDVISGDVGFSKVVWYSNDGGSDPTFTERTIDGAVINARQVAYGDLDNDGDIDVVSSAQSAGDVLWFESDGATPPTFTTNVLSSALAEPAGVCVADFNGDGHLDVAACDLENLGTEVRWFANDGAADPTFSNNLLQGATSGHFKLHAADMDGDGDVDVVPQSLNTSGGWYESSGGTSPTFTFHSITGLSVSRQTVPIDFDKDGDLDILEAEASDGTVNWYENDGQQPASFSQQIEVVPSTDAQYGIGAGDLDRDGDLDIILTYRNINEIVALENTGSQYTAVLTPTTLMALGEDTSPKAIFSLDLTHNGIAGDRELYFKSYTILFEESAADPLSSGEMAGMFDDFHVRKDNGAGIFDILSNDYIESFSGSPMLMGGVLSGASIIEPNRDVAPGETDTFYFAVDPAGMAASAMPHQFIATFQGANIDAVYSRTPEVSVSSVSLSGNALADASTPTITFGIAPFAATTVVLAPPTFRTGPIDFLVTFSEDVVGFGSDNDLDITLTGTAAFTSISFAGGPDVYTVTVNGLLGDGTMLLLPSTESDIMDLDGIPLESAAGGPVVTIDNTAPVITITGDNPATVEAGDTYADAGATANDNVDGDVTGSINTVSTVNDTTLGMYTVTYTVSDTAGNLAQAVRNVNVVDTTVPTIALTDGDLTLECGIDTFLEPGFSANDNIDGDITADVVVAGDTVDVSMTGTYVITYNVMDSSNNSSIEVTRTVTVQDTTPPDITILGDNPIEVTQLETYADEGATANDVCDGDLTSSITMTDDVDTSTIGSYTVTYSVTDVSGNTAMVDRTVNVIPRPSDLNEDGTINASDIQLIINIVLGIGGGGIDGDVDGDGFVNSIDIQLVINTVLGIA